MKEIGEEKKMAVKEVAIILGVTTEAIKKHVRELFPDSISNGRETTLSEYQVTEIKKRMIPTTQVVANVTEIEKQEIIIRAMQYLQDGYNAMKMRAEVAEQKIAIDAPKVETYDRFVSHETFMNFRDSAATIGMKERDFMDFLRSKYIYKTTRDEYRAYSEYAEYFSVRPYASAFRVGAQLMLTVQGMSFFDKIINGGTE